MDFIKLILLFLLRSASQPVSQSALLCFDFLLWYHMPSSIWYSPSVVPKSSQLLPVVCSPSIPLRYRENRRVFGRFRPAIDKMQIGLLQRTLLCRLMVYSRVTTSAMAERCFFWVWTLDISNENDPLASKDKQSRRVNCILTEWGLTRLSAVVGEVVDYRGWKFQDKF